MLTRYLIELTNKGYTVKFDNESINYPGLKVILSKNDNYVVNIIPMYEIDNVSFGEDGLLLFYLKNMLETFEIEFEKGLGVVRFNPKKD